MNVVENRVREVECEVFQASDVLRCLLHTVLFNRAIGLVGPVPGGSEMFAVEYPTCGDAGVERAVEEAVEEAMRAPEPIGPDLDRARVSVAFFHEERRRALFGLTVHVDRVYWERWTVSVVMRSSRRTEAEDALDRERRQALLDDAVRGAVVEIATLATREPDRMPPHDFASSSAIPFPYIIETPSKRAESSDTWLSKLVKGGVGVDPTGGARFGGR